MDKNIIKKSCKKRLGLIKILSCVLIISALASIFIISSSAEESYVLDGAYSFKSNIDFSTDVSANVEFTLLYSPEKSFSALGVQDNSLIFYDPDASVPYISVASSNGNLAPTIWTDYSCQYVVFDNVTVSKEFYNWFTSNAEECCVLDGVYAFKCDIDLSTNLFANVEFTLLHSPEKSFSALEVHDNSLIFYDPDASVPYISVASSNGNLAPTIWTDYSCQYVVFDNVTVSKEFYNWFTANSGQDYLSGHYKFGDFLDPIYLGSEVYAYVNFKSPLNSDVSFNFMSYSISSASQYVLSYNGDSSVIFAFSLDNDGYSWTDSKYMDFYVEKSLVPPDFYLFVTTNTIYVPDGCVLFNGTYEFPDVLPENGAFISNILFDYGFDTYYSFNFERGTLYFGLGGGEFKTVYDSTQGGWLDKQSIRFTDCVVTPDFVDNFEYLINYGQPKDPVYTYDFVLESVFYDLVVQTEDDSEGGILTWIKNIFSGIKNLPATIASHIRVFFDSLGNKINALGDFLLEGIKSLFVPSEEDILDLSEDFRLLLEERFGAVYDSSEIVDDFVNAFLAQSQTAMIPNEDGDVEPYTISIPSVSVDLAGTSFTFGGWEVPLRVEKFDALYDVLRLITNIVASFLVVNALRKRLGEVLA